MATDNYGVGLKKGTTSIGEIVKISVPEVSTEKKESTSHASSGKREFIPSGLLELSDFTVTINAISANLVTLYTDMKAKTVAAYTIDYTTGSGLADWTFNAFPLSIKISEMDAQSPDVLRAEIKFAVGSFSTFDIVAPA